MNLKLQFEPVMDRLKEAVGAQSYAELGRMIGMSTSAYANRKRAGSIPYDSVIPLAYSRNISIDWLLFGERPDSELGRQAANSQPVIDAELLTRVLVTMKRALSPSIKDEELIEFGRLAGLAGIVYNKVTFEENKNLQTQLIEHESKEYAHVMNLVSTAEDFASTRAKERKHITNHGQYVEGSITNKGGVSFNQGGSNEKD